MRFAYSPLNIAILTALASQTYANESQISEEIKTNTVSMTPIEVEVKAKQEVGKTVYTKEDLEKTPNSSKNITDFLKVNPNVQFSREQRSADSQAELRPSEISINGAQTYRNKFVINGVNTTNNLDPLASGNSYSGKLDGGSQGIALNTDLICKLELIDSNVSAAYGEFTGGVVNAETCAPNTEIGKIHGSLTYDYTESDWSRYHFTDEEEAAEFEDPTSSNNKEYKKHGLSLNLYSKLSEQWGINSYASKRESIVPVMSGLEDRSKVKSERNNINLGTTLFYTPSDTIKAKFGFDLGDLDSLNFVDKRINSKSISNTETLTFFGELESKLNNSTLKQNISYQTLSQARENDSTTGILWKQTPTKNWSSNPGEGATSSDIELHQDTFSYSLKNAFDTIQIGNSMQQLSFGMGYDYSKVAWERPNDAYMYNQPKTFTSSSGISCTAGDILCDEATDENNYQGQYQTNGKYYQKGKVNIDQQRVHTFIENTSTWDNFSARLGLRADYDSLSKNLNIAPRTAFNYKPLKNDLLSFTTGWNRYYANYTLATELQDQLAFLEYNLKRTKNQTEDYWAQTGLSDLILANSNIQRANLKTPYADEIVFAINSQVKNWNLGLKWVNRDSKDEITKNRFIDPTTSNTIDHFEYSNSGKAKADIYTLTLRNTLPVVYKNSLHGFNFGFDYTESEKNYLDYSESYNVNSNTAAEDRDIIFNGSLIQFNERPVENFNQPWTARFGWDIEFSNLPLKINNFLSYKSEYKDTYKLKNKVEHDGVLLEAYATDTIRPRFSWDMRTTYDFNFAKDYKAIFGLTINNITNRHNIYTTPGISESTNRLRSEIGRQFIADVTFKF